MNARLGDAGIARVLDAAEGNAAATQVQGTLNYMDPGYMRTGTLNDKSDIYRRVVMVHGSFVAVHFWYTGVVLAADAACKLFAPSSGHGFLRMSPVTDSNTFFVA